MSDATHTKSSARPNHRQNASQTEFTKRLRHLQRSEPVNPKDLTRRLEGLLAGSENGSKKRNIYIEAKAVKSSTSRSRSLSSSSTLNQNARDSALNPLHVARSSLVGDTQDDEDMGLMSRVANALQACREADPHRSPVYPSALPSAFPLAEENEETQRRESATSAQEEFAEVTRAVARRSVVFSAPKVVEIQQPKEPMRRPPSMVPKSMSDNIANTMKKRGAAGRKVPAPLILTMVPKASRPNLVDVSSPITTKPNSALPNLEPLSPFGASFSQNAGSFLVYQPKMSDRHSAMSVSSAGLNSTRPASPTSPVATYSPSRSKGGESTVAAPETRNSWHPKSIVTNMQARPAEKEGLETFPAFELLAQSSMEESSTPISKSLDPSADSRSSKDKSSVTQNRPNSLDNSRIDAAKSVPDFSGQARRRSDYQTKVPSIVLSEGGESESADEQSDRGVSPIFEECATVTRSSRTSLDRDQQTQSNCELERKESKRVGFSPEQFVEYGFAAAASEGVTTAMVSRESAWPQPRGHEMQEPLVSPLNSPKLNTFPKRISSLIPSPERETFITNPNRNSIPRKPVNPAYFEYRPQGQSPKQFAPPPQAARHDSTGFSAAREYLRDSVDGEHAQIRMETIRQVHSAAHRGSDASVEQSPNPPQLPPLRTRLGSKPGQWEVIAEGIALIDSDSPTIGRVTQKLPAPTHNKFSEPLSNAVQASNLGPNENGQGSTSDESPSSEHNLPPMPDHQPPPPPTSNDQNNLDIDINESPAAMLQRALSRDRRGTDATITSLSSKPDYRARPLIQDPNALPSFMNTSNGRPKTAGARPQDPSPPMPSLPGKMRGTKIKFPPRANTSEVSHMSPESLKLLHEQENLLRLRYEAVLSPIDVALKSQRTSANNTPTLNNPSGGTGKKHNHNASKSVDIHIAVQATPVPNADIDFAREQEQIAREQAAIRGQRRNLGAAARNYSAPPEYGVSDGFGEPMGLPEGFPPPSMDFNTKSSFTFDDDVTPKRKKWKFWKAGR